MGAARRSVAVLATAIVAALGIAALVHAQRHPDQALGGAGAGAWALQFAAGVGAWMAGVHLALRRSLRVSGPLLAASGVTLLLGAIPLPEAPGAALFTAALTGGAFTPALAGACAFCHPFAGRLGAALAGATIGTIAILSVLPVATFDPVLSGCFACPRNLLVVHGDPALHDTAASAGLRADALLCALLAVLAAARWTRQPTLVRWAAAPVAAGGALVAALGAGAFTHAVAVAGPRVDGTARALWLAQCAVLALAAAGVGVQALRARVLRGRIADIVVATLASPERLREALALSLGDPALAIAYPGARNGPVDAEGRPARDPAPGTEATEVTRGARVVALLRHNTALAHAPERLAAAARAAGPALEHASLRARLRAELAELSASRMRVVQVADAERQRAERDLHDGAQQRLIALSLALRRADDATLARAQEEVRAALDDLRELAHGIHPVALSDAGLQAALHGLAQDSRVPVRLDAVPPARFPKLVEGAAYRLVLDAVRSAERDGDGRLVSVGVELTADALDARITLPGVDAVTARVRLHHAADRIAALDGELIVRAERGAAQVEARIPCGS